MTDEENQQLDREIIDRDREAQLPELADAVLSDLDLTRRLSHDENAAGPWDDEDLDAPEIPASNQQGVLMGLDPELLALGWPPWLVKAARDPFMYAVGLRNGLTLTFNEAQRLKEAPAWVRLLGVAQYTFPFSTTKGLEEAPFRVREAPYTFTRGLEVRLVDILWVADAPFGS